MRTHRPGRHGARSGARRARWPAPPAGRARRPVASDGFDDLAGLEAARADVVAGRLAVEDEPDALQVRVEAPLRGDHRVRAVVPARRLLPADGANPGHAAGHGSSVGEPMAPPRAPSFWVETATTESGLPAGEAGLRPRAGVAATAQVTTTLSHHACSRLARLGAREQMGLGRCDRDSGRLQGSAPPKAGIRAAGFGSCRILLGEQASVRLRRGDSRRGRPSRGPSGRPRRPCRSAVPPGPRGRA